MDDVTLLPPTDQPPSDAALVPAKRGRGRPRSVELIAPDRTLPEHLERIHAYHSNVQTYLAQGAMSALLCGFELLAAKNQVGYGDWEDWVDEYCQIPLRTVQRYMAAAEQAYRRIKSLKQVSDFALGVSPLDLSEPKRRQLIDAVKASTDGCTIQQLYLDLGVIKPPGKRRGGNAKLISWLQDRHPECEARSESDLPPDIAAEWQRQCEAVLQSDKTVMLMSAEWAHWDATLRELFDRCDRREAHRWMTTEMREGMASRLQTLYGIMTNSIKADRSNR